MTFNRTSLTFSWGVLRVLSLNRNIILGVILLLLSLSEVKTRSTQHNNNYLRNDSDNRQSYLRDDSNEDDGDEDGDDGIKLGKGALIGLIIAVLAIAIAAPALICFCFGCLCFKPKESKVLSPSEGKISRDNLELEQRAGRDSIVHKADESRRNSEIAGPSRAAIVPTAPEYLSQRFGSNGDVFYFNNGGYEPPPPYVFESNDGARRASSASASTTTDAWNVKEVDEKVKESRLGPSLIKNPI